MDRLPHFIHVVGCSFALITCGYRHQGVEGILPHGSKKPSGYAFSSSPQSQPRIKSQGEDHPIGFPYSFSSCKCQAFAPAALLHPLPSNKGTVGAILFFLLLSSPSPGTKETSSESSSALFSVPLQHKDTCWQSSAFSLTTPTHPAALACLGWSSVLTQLYHRCL